MPDITLDTLAVSVEDITNRLNVIEDAIISSTNPVSQESYDKLVSLNDRITTFVNITSERLSDLEILVSDSLKNAEVKELFTSTIEMNDNFDVWRNKINKTIRVINSLDNLSDIINNTGDIKEIKFSNTTEEEDNYYVLINPESNNGSYGRYYHQQW